MSKYSWIEELVVNNQYEEAYDEYSKIINGKEVAKSLRESLATQVVELNKRYGRTPNLVVILVGEDPGSVSYVTGKAKDSLEVGFKNTTIRKDESISEEVL